MAKSRMFPPKLEAQLLVGEVLVNSFLVFVWSLGRKNNKQGNPQKIHMSNGFPPKKNEGEGEVDVVLFMLCDHTYMDAGWT